MIDIELQENIIRQINSIYEKELDGDEIVSLVIKTNDYDRFCDLQANRDVDHVNKIVRSMSKRFVPSPITINEDYEVIDGQNRKEASKILMKPVYYMVFEDLSIEDCRAMNAGSRNWNTQDYIKSFAKEGSDSHVRFLEFMNKYPDFPVSILQVALKRNMKVNRSNGTSITERDFDFGDYIEAEKILNIALSYKGIGEDLDFPIYKRREFIGAIKNVYNNPLFDNEKILNTMKMYPKFFYACINVKDYIQMLEDALNFKKKDRVRL